MNSETMKKMFERLDNGTRFSSPACDPQVFCEEPEAADWNENRDGFYDYRTYASERIMGKSHEEAVAYVEKLQAHR